MIIDIRIVRTERDIKNQVRVFSAIMKKTNKIKNDRILILTPELFAKLFSPMRLNLLLELSKHEKKTITNLAKKLTRKFEVIHRDLKLFEHFGLVKLKKENKSVLPELAGQIKFPVIS